MARSNEVVPAKDADAKTPDSGNREINRRGSDEHEALVSMGTMLTGRRWRFAARWIGLLIFVAGAGLLGFVFIEALRGFGRLSTPGYLQNEINKISGDAWTEIAIAGVSVLGAELLRLLYLLLLGVLGSLIASRGIHFFAASESVIDEAVMAGVDEER
jgi:hypothetical protein